MPDPKADPLAALLYAGSPDMFKSARFIYEMTMEMGPADDVTAKILGEEGVAMMQAFGMQASGTGAMQVVDAAAGKTNMQMEIEMGVLGQTMKVETIVIGDSAWARMNGGAWQKSDDATAGSSAGDPAAMLETFRAATKVEWLDNKPLDGEAVHHLRYVIDPEKMDLSSMLKSTPGVSDETSAEEALAILKQMTLEGEAWLAASDLSLRQQRMLMTMIVPMPDEEEARLKVVMNMLMRYTEVNKPVVIEPPK
jgi:hypothetical protein